jgi:hypothetical protein
MSAWPRRIVRRGAEIAHTGPAALRVGRHRLRKMIAGVAEEMAHPDTRARQGQRAAPAADRAP